MNKFLKLLVLATMFTFGGIFLAACTGEPPENDGKPPPQPTIVTLEAPTNLQVMLSSWVYWDFVSNASSFNIYINGELYEHGITYHHFRLFDPDNSGTTVRTSRFAIGEYEIAVRAIGQKTGGITYLDSPLSTALPFHVIEPETQEINIDLYFDGNNIRSKEITGLPDNLLFATEQIFAVHNEERTWLVSNEDVATYDMAQIRHHMQPGLNTVHFEIVRLEGGAVINGIDTIFTKGQMIYRTNSISFDAVRISQPSYLFLGQRLEWQDVPNALAYTVDIEHNGHRHRPAWGIPDNFFDPQFTLRNNSNFGTNGLYIFEVTALAGDGMQVIAGVPTFFINSLPLRLEQQIEFRNAPLLDNVRLEEGIILFDDVIVCANQHYTLQITVGQNQMSWWVNTSIPIDIPRIARMIATTMIDSYGEMLVEFGLSIRRIQWDNNLAIIYHDTLASVFNGFVHLREDIENLYFDGTDLSWDATGWATRYEVTFYNSGGGSIHTTAQPTIINAYRQAVLQHNLAFVRALRWEQINGIWHISYTHPTGSIAIY